MAAIQNGRFELLELLVKRYERALFGYAQRLLGQTGAAEDAFQETFLKVFHKRASYRQGSPLRPWLYRICLNVCRDALRRRGRRPESALDPELPVMDGAPGPEALAQQQQLSRRIRAAVEALPEKQRDVFLLHHYQQLAYPEIAEILEIPVGTIKSRMFHATRALAEALQDLR